MNFSNRFYTYLPFPVLDSFPRDIFRAPSFSGIPILGALTSSSRTSGKVKALESVARRIISVDERETLTNGLAEISELYESGMMSNSDLDD